MRGFDEVFLARIRGTRSAQRRHREGEGLKLLAVSAEAGMYMAASADGRMVFVTGHPEYDRLTLKAEYERDVGRACPSPFRRTTFPGTTPRGSLWSPGARTRTCCIRTG